MNKLFKLFFVLFFCSASIAIYAMEIEAPKCDSIEISIAHHGKKYKKWIYAQLVHYSVRDARTYLAGLQVTSPIERAIITQVRNTIEHFYAQYQRFVLAHTELQLSQVTLGSHNQTDGTIAFSIDDTIVETAIKMQQEGFSMVKHLIQIVGFDYMVKTYKNAQGKSILHCAVSACNERIVRWLFESMYQRNVPYVDDVINAVDTNGHSSLDIAMACIKDNESIVDMLVEKGAIYTAPKAPKLRVRTLVCDD